MKMMGRGMKITVALLLWVSMAWGTAITSNGSGDWGTPATWAGGVVPGNGDTAVLRCQDTITVSDTRIVGTSPAATGTAFVLTMQNDGTGSCQTPLHITSTGHLTVRGEISDMGDFTFIGGGVLEMDAHLAASPMSQKYAIVVPAGQTFRGPAFITSGTGPGAHATIMSNAGGGAAFLKNSGGFSVTFYIALDYVDISNMGDDTNPWLAVNFWNSVFIYSITHSTFTNCGGVTGVSSFLTNGTFVHTNNVHTNSRGGEYFHQALITSAIGSGTRQIMGNVFDVPMSASIFNPPDFTISGNYFGVQTWWGGSLPWASYTTNFVRYTDAGTAAIGADLAVTLGNSTNSYYFQDTDRGNIHVLGAGSSNCTLTNSIFSQAGSGLAGQVDAGEAYFLANLPCTVSGSLFLPNAAGYSSLEIGSLLAVNTLTRATVEHNTVWGGFTRGTGDSVAGSFPAIFLGEGGNGTAGSLLSFRSNLMTNPQLTNYISNFLMLGDQSQSATPLNYCASAAACDYNSAWNVNTTVSGTNTGFLNAAGVLKGYATATAGVGAHDVPGANPGYLCSPPTCIRNLETYDRSGLGNIPAVWSGGATYAIGDFVSSTDATVPSAIYWGLPVNYRYINIGACASSNPHPGVGTNWRDCWEWATLYRIRTDIAANGTSSTFLNTMYTWIRSGWAPTNTSLRTAAHDGTTIGAVPWVAGTHRGRVLLGLP